jgi:ATP adenylyltransferase/5',5'''-P-1,P-4-tetraphosphate phosphorylase II
MKFETFILYQLVKTMDVYGNLKMDYEEIEEIEVLISETHKTEIVNEQQYFVKQVKGITVKQFESKEKYKIANNNIEYTVESFINGRWTQLLLKEVVA